MKTIGVYPASAYHRLSGLFEALSEWEPVRFQAATQLSDLAVNGLLLVDVSSAQAQAAGQGGCRVFAFISEVAQNEQATSATVRFAESPRLHPVLRSQKLEDSTFSSSLKAIPSGGEVLASKEQLPVWVRIGAGDNAVDLMAGSPPDTRSEPYLFQHCQSGRFMQLLPLLHFLREVAAPSSLPPSPVRACFMFDDPNLHWVSYGHIEYRSLIESAQKHHYHAAFATIPLDACFVQRKAVGLLRDNRKWLSLLVHGNNHTHRELAQLQNGDSGLRLAAQSLRRIDQLERRTGLKVPRVMAAPHGACRHEMADALLRVGYEAACISRGSIMSHNPGRVWPVVIGLRPAEFLGAGFPVMPRIGLTRNCQTNVVLAAFFGQPIILVGHHQDVSEGYGIIEEIADFINRFGAVQWTNLEEIARANFVQRQEGEVFLVRSFARRFRLAPPSGVSRIELELAWQPSDGQPQKVTVRQDEQEHNLVAENGRLSLPVSTGGPVDVTWLCPDAVNYQAVRSPRPSVWPVARRLLAEGRDRLQGLSHPRNPQGVNPLSR